MDIIFTHSTARAIYSADLPHQVVGDPDRCQSILDNASDRGESARAVLWDCEALRPLVDNSAEVSAIPELLVGKSTRRGTSRQVMHHQWNGDAPGGSLWYLPSLSAQFRAFCVSPPLYLVQRCRTLNVEDAALLAMELCGHYQLNPLAHGALERRNEALTCASELATYASQLTSQAQGIAKARRAAHLAMDDSLSPRESALALFLSIGSRNGGCGLPKPVLNQPLEVPAKSRGLLDGYGSIRFDLYWPNAGVAVEYDSNLYHDNRRSLMVDKSRAMVAKTMGITLFSITNDMCRSLETFEPCLDQLVYQILHRRPWPLSPRNGEKRRALFEKLFHGHDAATL